MTLKLRIRELRESRGWSQETLAAKVSISPPHLSQVERGIKNLNNRLIDELSEHLEVEPYELFARTQKRSDVSTIINGLTPEDLARVRDFAAALAATRKPGDQQ